MPEYDNNLTGVLFKNDSDNPNAPAFTGKAEIEGTDYRMAAWRKTSTNTGKPFISIKFESQADFESRMAEMSEGAEDALGI